MCVFFSIFHFSTVLLKGHVRVVVLHHIIQYASLFFLILLCLDISVAIAYICEEDEQQRLELYFSQQYTVSLSAAIIQGCSCMQGIKLDADAPKHHCTADLTLYTLHVCVSPEVCSNICRNSVPCCYTQCTF